MSTYVPDRWAIIEIKNSTETLYKVLASWGGGYLYGASWKISSGITSVTTTDEAYEFLNYSGSTYVCSKNGYGISAYTASVYSSFEKQLGDKAQIRLLEENEATDLTFTKVIE